MVFQNQLFGVSKGFKDRWEMQRPCPATHHSFLINEVLLIPDIVHHPQNVLPSLLSWHRFQLYKAVEAWTRNEVPASLLSSNIANHPAISAALHQRSTRNTRKYQHQRNESMTHQRGECTIALSTVEKWNHSLPLPLEERLGLMPWPRPNVEALLVTEPWTLIPFPCLHTRVNYQSGLTGTGTVLHPIARIPLRVLEKRRSLLLTYRHWTCSSLSIQDQIRMGKCPTIFCFSQI